MLASQWTEEGITIVEEEPGPLQAGWARIRVSACGICGSDLHGYKEQGHGRPGTRPGHEFVGTLIDASTPGLPDVMYAIEPLLTCRTCEFCLLGKPEQCVNQQLMSVHVPGAIAQSVDVPENALHQAPADLTPLEASITEPFAVCTRAIHLARLKLDTRVLVLGGGSLGLISGLLARDFVNRVGVTCRYERQAEAARALGLEAIPEPEAAAWAHEHGPDVVLETVGGHADTLQQGIDLCRPGGRLVFLGLFSEPVSINARTLLHKEIMVTGSKIYGLGDHGREFAGAAALVPRYREEAKVLQTHQFRLQQVGDAFATAADKNTGAIKVTVMCE
jgi:(R,R)-butanediol dehydrogenase / meso-butanediol dehydrogenase / diacetyl reductase